MKKFLIVQSEVAAVCKDMVWEWRRGREGRCGLREGNTHNHSIIDIVTGDLKST